MRRKKPPAKPQMIRFEIDLGDHIKVIELNAEYARNISFNLQVPKVDEQ